MKYNTDSAKLYVLDKTIVDELRGEKSNPFAIFKGTCTSDDDLINDALASNNAHLLENSYFRRFYSVRCLIGAMKVRIGSNDSIIFHWICNDCACSVVILTKGLLEGRLSFC